MVEIKNKKLRSYIEKIMDTVQNQLGALPCQKIHIDSIDKYILELNNMEEYVKKILIDDEFEEYLVATYLLVIAVSYLSISLKDDSSQRQIFPKDWLKEDESLDPNLIISHAFRTLVDYSIVSITSIENGYLIPSNGLVRIVVEFCALIIILIDSKEDFKIYAQIRKNKRESRNIWKKHFSNGELRKKLIEIEKRTSLEKCSENMNKFRGELYYTLSKMIHPSYESIVLNTGLLNEEKYKGPSSMGGHIIEPLHHLHIILSLFLSTFFEIVKENKYTKNFPTAEPIIFYNCSSEMFLKLYNELKPFKK